MSTFGDIIKVTLFGESHGSEMGVVISGLTPGLDIDLEYIRAALSARRPYGKISTARTEEDNFRIVSGRYNGKTTGAPLAIIIPNENVRSADYSDVSHIARPGHADYTADVRYGGYNDPNGGGHFSGRLTAPLVAGGAVILQALEKRGIKIGTHISECAGVKDRPFNDAEKDIDLLRGKKPCVLDDNACIRMTAEAEKAAACGDSVGGVLETCITGLPAGIGEPWTGSIESEISKAVFAVPAVKGIEFGDGFSLAGMKGSEANDEMRIKDGKVITLTNHNGGINGGISNGMPILFRTCIKPTPTIYREQKSVDYKKMTDEIITGKGRHDPAIVMRAGVVISAVSAIIIADLAAKRFGPGWLKA